MKRLLLWLLSLILVCSLSNVSAHKLKRYPTYHVHMVVGENMLAAGKQYLKKMHFTNTNPRIIRVSWGYDVDINKIEEAFSQVLEVAKTLVL